MRLCQLPVFPVKGHLRLLSSFLFPSRLGRAVSVLLCEAASPHLSHVGSVPPQIRWGLASLCTRSLQMCSLPPSWLFPSNSNHVVSRSSKTKQKKTSLTPRSLLAHNHLLPYLAEFLRRVAFILAHPPRTAWTRGNPAPLPVVSQKLE